MIAVLVRAHHVDQLIVRRAAVEQRALRPELRRLRKQRPAAPAQPPPVAGGRPVLAYGERNVGTDVQLGGRDARTAGLRDVAAAVRRFPWESVQCATVATGARV